MTDFEREERAFREAFAGQALDAPTITPEPAVRQRGWLSAGLVAATVLAVVGTTFVLQRDGDPKPPVPTPVVTPSYWDQHEGRWISFRDIEILAPADWSYDYEAIRPDCITEPPTGERDSWADDVPRKPYVSLGSEGRGVPLVGCIRDPRSGDPDPAFGQLPFRWWQPYVKVEVARPDLGRPESRDADLEYRGWHLTRSTTRGIQVTVLSAPDNDALGAAVQSSLRAVTTSNLGCQIDSPVQRDGFRQPTGAPVPTADAVGSVTICDYDRDTEHGGGLGGSLRISGAAARDLVQAIHDAPAGGGPNTPNTCLHDTSRDRVIALRFFDAAENASSVLAEAFVYTASCFGNGIVDSRSEHQLTRANCGPLFAQAPIGFWGGSAGVFESCATSRGSDGP